MTTPNLPAVMLARLARDLQVGDRINGYLLPAGMPGDVLFVKAHTQTGEAWVFVAFEQADGRHDSTDFLADSPIVLDRAVDPAERAGLNYGRGDESAQPSAGRRPAHVGGVHSGGVVVEEPAPVHFQFLVGDTACGLVKVPDGHDGVARTEDVTCPACAAVLADLPDASAVSMRGRRD